MAYAVVVARPPPTLAKKKKNGLELELAAAISVLVYHYYSRYFITSLL